MLNAGQKRAIATIDGPVMILAGPGTGKTQVLTQRIANILKETDTAPEQILALTFTGAGVSAMRERLVKIIGRAAYRVPIFTFHAFAGEVITRFPEYFPELIGSRTVSKLDQIMLMQKVLNTATLMRLASPRAPYYYLTKVLDTISLLKREVISFRELSHRLAKKARDIKQEAQLEKNKELVKLYRAYEQALTAEKLYDYDDMVLALVQALETNREFRLILQEEYQYLLADEYQDGNVAQNKVLELLASFHASPNIFIVGSPVSEISMCRRTGPHSPGGRQRW